MWCLIIAVGVISMAPSLLHAQSSNANTCVEAASRYESFSVPAPNLGRTSNILVYLPPGYDCELEHRYPVFYFNDGQQLFDWSRPRSLLGSAQASDIAAEYVLYGTWRLGSQLDRAYAEGRLPPMIIVGIASENGPRARDLVPVPWAGATEGRGTQFGAFVASALVPEIDRLYRTRANRYCRGIAGSSLGGVSSLQIGLAHAREFGLVLSLSPVLGDQAIADHIASLWSTPEGNLRSVILVDFDIGPVGDADIDWFEELLDARPDVRLRTIQRRPDDASHTIDSWAERVIPDLNLLIGGRCAG